MRRNANRRQALTLVLLAALVAMLVPARSTLADEDKSPSTIQIAFDGSAGYNSVEDVREAFRNPNVSRVVALDKTLVYTMPAEASSLLFTIKNVRENGLLTSVNYHSIVDGQPWMAVGMSQFKGPKNSYSCDVPVSADLVSAAVGFDVTASESLNVAAEAWVPQTAGGEDRLIHAAYFDPRLRLLLLRRLFWPEPHCHGHGKAPGWRLLPEGLCLPV